MGTIEVSDGTTSRSIPLPGLNGTIRIELVGEDAPRIVVPEGVRIDRVTE